MKNQNLSGNLFAKRKQALTIKETALSSSIAEYLDVHGIYNDRLNSGKIKVGSRMVHLCKPGTPDRFAIVKGQIVFIEVKQKDKEATSDQMIKHRELEESGAVVIVVDSFEDFEVKFKFVRRTIESVVMVGTASVLGYLSESADAEPQSVHY